MRYYLWYDEIIGYDVRPKKLREKPSNLIEDYDFFLHERNCNLKAEKKEFN